MYPTNFNTMMNLIGNCHWGFSQHITFHLESLLHHRPGGRIPFDDLRVPREVLRFLPETIEEMTEDEDVSEKSDSEDDEEEGIIEDEIEVTLSKFSIKCFPKRSQIIAKSKQVISNINFYSDCQNLL